MSDCFVIVADNDQPHRLPNNAEPFYDDGGALVFEQYIKDSDIESVKRRIRQLGGKYGKCRIARLEFVDSVEGEK